MLNKQQLLTMISAVEASQTALAQSVLAAAQSGPGGINRVTNFVGPLYFHGAALEQLRAQLAEEEEYEEDVEVLGEEVAEKPFAKKMRLAREAKAAARNKR